MWVNENNTLFYTDEVRKVQTIAMLRTNFDLLISLFGPNSGGKFPSNLSELLKKFEHSKFYSEKDLVWSFDLSSGGEYVDKIHFKKESDMVLAKLILEG